MKIQTKLPDGVQSIKYVKNHHWIELEDCEGNKTKLNDNGMIRYECPGCQFYCYTDCNRGILLCPVCRTVNLTKQWQLLQVCFVPEKESNFNMDTKKKVK